jgi:hypothetical protein
MAVPAFFGALMKALAQNAAQSTAGKVVQGALADGAAGAIQGTAAGGLLGGQQGPALATTGRDAAMRANEALTTQMQVNQGVDAASAIPGLLAPTPVNAGPPPRAQPKPVDTSLNRGLTAGETVTGGLTGLLFGGGLGGIPERYAQMRATKANAPYVAELEKRLGTLQANPTEFNFERRLELQKMLSASQATDMPDIIRRRADSVQRRQRPTGPMTAQPEEARIVGGIMGPYEEYGTEITTRQPTSEESSRSRRAALAEAVRNRIHHPNARHPVFIDFTEGSTAMNAYKEFYPGEYGKFWAGIRKKKGSKERDAPESGDTLTKGILDELSAGGLTPDQLDAEQYDFLRRLQGQ